MNIIYSINEFLGDFDNIVGTLGLVIAIIGVIVGVVGTVQLKKVSNIKSANKNSNIENQQTADSIQNNYGLGYKDTMDIAKDEVDKEINKLPKIRYGKEVPNNEEAKEAMSLS